MRPIDDLEKRETNSALRRLADRFGFDWKPDWPGDDDE
jgi:hypothetical protein